MRRCCAICVAEADAWARQRQLYGIGVACHEQCAARCEIRVGEWLRQHVRAGIQHAATPTTITVKWSDLAGGKPMASPDPAKITFISWVIPTPAGVGSATATVTTYDIDLTIDDLQFVP